jgi:RHS repeat-associated protein
MAYYVNPEGQRLRKSGAAGTSYFAPDRGGAMLAEYSGGAWIDYVWLNGQLIGRVADGQRYAIHDDQVGRPEAVTNGSGVVVWRAQNFAFTQNVTNAGIALNLGFPGQYYDAETSAWNNGFRDYKSGLGRYVESDPIGLGGGVNTYAYVEGDPISNVDLNGTNWEAFVDTLKDIYKTHELLFGAGVSAFGVLDGGSLSLTAGLSVRGVSVNLTSCGGVGVGAFAGAGGVFGLQKLDPCKPESSTSKIGVAEVGEGLVAGASVDTSGNGAVALGNFGVGVGGYVAGELCTTKSWYPIDF